MKKIITLLFTIALGAILNTATAEPKFKADQETSILFIQNQLSNFEFEVSNFDYQISNFETLNLPLSMQLSKTNKVTVATGELAERMKAVDALINSKFLKIDAVQSAYVIHPVLLSGKDQRFKFNYMQSLKEHWLFYNGETSFSNLKPFRLMDEVDKEFIACFHPKFGITFTEDNTLLPNFDFELYDQSLASQVLESIPNLNHG